jgi:galactokinase
MSTRGAAIPHGEERPDLVALFGEVFPRGKGDVFMARAPGRVNLIGEHTDYNEGFVLPVAIDRELRVLGQRRPDDRVVVYSANFKRRVSFELDALGRSERQTWINYPQGVADALQRAGHHLPGMNLLLWGNIPPGAGMSSSAAVEIACMLVFERLAGLHLDARQEVLLAQRAENLFVGVQTGIMDQFISRLGQQGHALLIDCRSLEYEPVALALPGIALGVVHSGVPRGLAGSAYNDRRRECAEGVRLLQGHLPGIRALRDVAPADFARLAEHLPEPIRRRCRHVVTENARVGLAAEALRAGDVERLGTLFAASQDSMRDDYEISLPEIDALVQIARAHGSLASRMTGGGFGGCTVNLVPAAAWEGFARGVAAEYPARTQRKPVIFRCHVVDGASLQQVA